MLVDGAVCAQRRIRCSRLPVHSACTYHNCVRAREDFESMREPNGHNYFLVNNNIEYIRRLRHCHCHGIVGEHIRSFVRRCTSAETLLQFVRTFIAKVRRSARVLYDRKKVNFVVNLLLTPSGITINIRYHIMFQ